MHKCSNKRFLWAIIGLTGIILLLTSCQSATESQSNAQTITIKGSDTMVVLATQWAEAYMQTHSDIQIQVSGGGSGTGIAALINGITDIANASRPMAAEEMETATAHTGKELLEIETALDGIAFYIHPDNPVKELTMGQLADIYTGKINNWQEVGGNKAPIILYSRENNSGTYAFVKEFVLNDADYAANAQTLSGTGAVVNAVKNDDNGIGYGGIAYASGIDIISVKKDVDSPPVTPNIDTVLDRSYPLSRYLYWYMLDPPSPEILSLIDWVLGPDGQKIVEEVGYYPVNK